MGGQVGGIRISRSALMLLGAVLVLALGVSSCAKPPVADQQAAQAAIEKARTAEAAEDAANELQAAMDSVAKADAEVNTQNGKFALFRSYKKATALYLSANQTAVQAEQNAIANKEQFRKDSEAAIASSQANIVKAKELFASKEVAALKRGKETREALKQIEAELMAADSTLMTQVQPMHQQEKFKQSLSMARGVDQKVQALMSEIQQAIETKKTMRGMPQ